MVKCTANINFLLMKKSILFIYLLIFNMILFSQNKENIQINVDHQANISASISLPQEMIQFNRINDWLATNNQINLNFINHTTKEILIKGQTIINLSKSESVYKTRMFYSLHILNKNDKTLIEIKDIYYESFPEYGKQGTPSIITYPSDWYSHKKLYKKSGKERWLNAIVKQNTINKSSEILNEALAFIY